MTDRFLKITYHGAATGATKKLNAYLRMPSSQFLILRREIEMYLFQERQLPQTEIRMYWFDADKDEIAIVNQNDYDIFMNKCEKNMHMQIATIDVEKEDAKPEPETRSPEVDASNFIIHDGVECDSCKLLPIVGFRYKCVQCPNFDLCQSCEALHRHPDHLMVRLPTNNGPSLIDAFVSGPSHHHRRGSRRSGFRTQCPFAEATASTQTTPAGASCAAADSHREGRRERRHARRQGGVLSQFVEMMMNLPEASPTPTAADASKAAEAPTAPTADEPKKKEEVLKKTEGENSTESVEQTTKVPVEEPVVTSVPEEPVAAPRTKDQPNVQATPVTTPTTPVISLENIAQMVNPEYMRAGIEILNNFSEMFAKMIDPNEGASFGSVGNSMTSTGSSTTSSKPETGTEVPQKPDTNTPVSTKPETVEPQAASIKSTISTDPVVDGIQTPPEVPIAEPEERRRSESLDQDWQMIDNTASPIGNVSSSDALINLNITTPVNAAASSDAAVSPATFGQLSEVLRQHVNEEQQREQTSTAHTQTSPVESVSTSTSTTSVATNSTSTSTTARPPAPEEKRHVPIYHTNEQINAAVHAMMAMGFSNEGAWLTQLLESVEGNIPAALDIMHTSQSGRN